MAAERTAGEGQRNVTPAALDNADKAANSTLANLDNKPATINDDQWPTAKKQFESMAHKTLGWVAAPSVEATGGRSPCLQAAATRSMDADTLRTIVRWIFMTRPPRNKSLKRWRAG